MLRSLSGPSTTRSRSLLLLALTCAALFLVGFGPARAMAATYTWNGTTSAWGTATNWDGPSGTHAVPGSTDSVIIPDDGATIGGNDPTITAGSFSVSGIQLAPDDAFNGGATIVIAGGSLTDALNGTFGDSVPAEGVIYASGGTFNVTGPGSIAGSGVIQADTGGTVSFAPGAAATQIIHPTTNLGSADGTLNVASGTVVAGNTDNSTIFSGGSLTGPGTLELPADVEAIVTANQSIPAGFTLAVLGQLEVNPTFTVTNHGTIALTGDGSIFGATGTVDNTAGATISTGTGAFAAIEPTLSENLGLITVATNSGLTINHPSTSVVSTGHLLLGNHYTVNGDLTLDTVTPVIGVGATTVDLGAAAAIDSDQGGSGPTLFRDTTTTVGNGTAATAVNITGDYTFEAATAVATNATVTIASAKTLTIDNALTLAGSSTVSGAGTLAIDNDGSSALLVPTGTATVSAPITSQGDINVAGTLAASTVALNGSAGVATVTSTGHLNGAIALSDGTLDNFGAVGTVTMTGGTLQTSGTLIGLDASAGSILAEDASSAPSTISTLGDITLSGSVRTSLVYASASTYSKLAAGIGSVTLGGTLDFLVLSPDAPSAVGTTLANIATSGVGTVSGDFAAINEDQVDGGWLSAVHTDTTHYGLLQHVATVTVNVTSVTQGGTLVATGAGFAPGETVDLQVFDENTGAMFSATTASGDGAFVATETIPATVDPSANFRFNAIGETSNAFAASAAKFTILAKTTTVLTQAAPTSTVGGAVALSATVSQLAYSDGTRIIPTGTVTFLDGSTALGTAPLSATGVATFSTSTLGAGAHVITAVYGGSAASGASTSAAVTQTVSAAAVTPTPVTPVVVTVPTLVANIGKTPTSTTLTSVLKTGLVNTLHCNQSCTVTSTLYVTAKEAKALGLLSAKSKSTKAVPVGVTTAVSKNGGAFTIHTKLTTKAKKRIAGLKSVTLSQTVKVTAGKTTTATTRRVTLRTPVIKKK